MATWPETPPATMEHMLAASIYLAETDTDMSGSLEEVTYRLVVELAKTRQASKDLQITLTNELERYKALWRFERGLATGALEECELLEDTAEKLAQQAEENFAAYTRATDDLANAQLAIEQLSPHVDWDSVFRGK